MSDKPSLSRALHSTAEIVRQIGHDPAVKEAAAGVVHQVRSKLADKVEQGAMQLRARNQVHGTTGEPAPSLGKATRRVGLALADAMARSTASREKAGRHPLRPAPRPHGGIANEILQEADATYQRVLAQFDDPLAEHSQPDSPISTADAEQDALAWAQFAAEQNTATPRRSDTVADTIRQEADATYRDELGRHELPSPSLSTAEMEADARAWAQLAEQASALPAAAIGAPAPGDAGAARDRHRSELPGDNQWRSELR